MVLRCNAECVKIKKKTKREGFKNITTGDVVCFKSEITSGYALSTTSASYVSTYNCRTKEKGYLSFKELTTLLEVNFDFNELDRSLFSEEE